MSVYFPDYEEYLETGIPGTITPVSEYAAIERDGKWGFLKLTFELEGLNPFEDIHIGDWYYNSVQWAVNGSITSGTNDEGTEFTPDRVCTDAEILTFLYRADRGDGEADGGDMAQAEAWAKEMGLIAEDYDVTADCTRATAVTYIWKVLGEKSAEASSFTDVDAEAEYAKAVDWAVANGVTDGTEDGTTFSPDLKCDRSQIVTFLYRAYVAPAEE